MNKNIKKIGKAVAGSALLVGATLTGAAGLASAASGSQDLGDYPAPFVDEDGQVQSTIVVGESAKTVDVVGAVNIAGSLGNAAFSEETKSVSVSGSGGSWSASNGVTLDTRNDDVYFGQNISAVRETLTDGDLDVLADAEFQDDSSTTYDITHNLNVGKLPVQFGTQANELDNEEPAVHVEVPSESNVQNGTSSGTANYLVNLQASIDSVDVEDSNVAGEEIELFGKEYTIASDHSDSGNSGRDFLKLYGSQETLDVQTGESSTITVDGEEHTIEVVSTDASSNQASIRVDGSISQENIDDTFDVGGQEVRVEEIVNIGANDDGDGIVEFAIGSEELKIYSGDQIQDEDDDDYEGTYALINDDTNWNTSEKVSSIDIYLGAEDDDEDALMAGESFSHSLFDQVEVHFGGLNPDASAEGDNVGEITVTTESDDTAVVDFETQNGDDASIAFAHDASSNLNNAFSGISLADSDDESIHVQEGAGVKEDEYFAADAGDFAHVWEVTSIDRDSTSSPSTDDEADVELRDVVTGNTVTADFTYDGSNHYQGNEIIDGQKYFFNLSSSTSDPAVEVTWGDNAGAGDTGDATTLYAAQDAASGSAVALTEPLSSLSVNQTYELPSTESTDSKVVYVEEDGGVLNVDVGDDNSNEITSATGTTTVGQVSYTFNRVDTTTFDLNVYDNTAGSAVISPAALAIQPEDDNDNEHAYVVTPGIDTGDNEMGVGDSGNVSYTDGYSTVQSEEDDDLELDYNMYGTHSVQDTDDQGDVTLNVPYGQSVVGTAVTGMDGDLSGQAGGSGSVTTMSPTGWPDAAALDSDSNIGSLKSSDELVLVGGPAVNSLVQELANDNKTMTGSEYSQGTAMVQLVNNAFTEGQDALVVAGYSGSDTREAANYVANYADHSEEMAGKTKVELTTAESTSAE